MNPVVSHYLLSSVCGGGSGSVGVSGGGNGNAGGRNGGSSSGADEGAGGSDGGGAAAQPAKVALSCERLEYKKICELTNTPSQFTLRWFVKDGKCCSYPWGHCKDFMSIYICKDSRMYSNTCPAEFSIIIDGPTAATYRRTNRLKRARRLGGCAAILWKSALDRSRSADPVDGYPVSLSSGARRLNFASIPIRSVHALLVLLNSVLKS
uniref:Uncharacterized protein n=1 Tax=Plectus sambesii TaxID=2011161 RepID=A0A914XQW9_9BILA